MTYNVLFFQDIKDKNRISGIPGRGLCVPILMTFTSVPYHAERHSMHRHIHAYRQTDTDRQTDRETRSIPSA